MTKIKQRKPKKAKPTGGQVTGKHKAGVFRILADGAYRRRIEAVSPVAAIDQHKREHPEDGSKLVTAEWERRSPTSGTAEQYIATQEKSEKLTDR